MACNQVPEFPSELLNEARRRNYQEMTLDELRGLRDAVQFIAHTAMRDNKLMKAAEHQEFLEVKGAILNRIETEVPQGTRDLRTRENAGGKTAEWARSIAAEHRKMSSLVYELDGLRMGGPLWEHFVRPMNESGNTEVAMDQEAAAQLHEILKPVLAEGRMSGKGEFFPALGIPLNHEEAMAIVLNMGNASNIQRLQDGEAIMQDGKVVQEGWSRAQLQTVVESLSEAETKAVQQIWDLFESYKSRVGALEQKTTGIQPEWIEPQPLITKFGTLRGGYYPVKFDRKRSARAGGFAAAEDAKDMQRAAFTSSTTRRSFTKERVKKVVGRPLVYSFQGVYQGLNEVIHDLAWREWLIDANKISRDHDIDQAIRTRFGDEGIQIFKTGIEDIARGQKPAFGGWEKFLSHINKNATVVGLGWNTISGMKQWNGFGFAAVRIGKGWVARGMIETLASPLKIVRWANQDPFMANRAITQERDIFAIRNAISGKSDFREAMEATYFALITIGQRMVDVPVYRAQYQKSIAAHESEDRARALAQQAVLDTQSGGQTKDLAQIQRGGLEKKLFTKFYSGFSAQLQISIERAKQAGQVFRSDAGLATKAVEPLSLAVDYLLTYGAQIAMSALIVKWIQDDDEPWWKVLAREQLQAVTGLMVGLRDMEGGFEKLFGLQQYKRDYAGPPSLRIFSEWERSMEQIHQGEWDKALRHALINLGGYAVGYPAAQINKSLDGIIALWDGETRNPAALILGPPR